MTEKPFFRPTDIFANRHIGPDENEIREMLKFLGFSSLDELVNHTVPKNIRLKRELNLPEPMSEGEVLEEFRSIAQMNKLYRNYIGMGYYDTVTPPVVLRNIMENPGWYTQYTPYQAEISQGRLEALLNFQTMVMDLTGMEIANASMLDEGTSAAEAMTMAFNVTHGKNHKFFVSENCFPQTIDIVKTRARHYGIEVIVGDHAKFDVSAMPVFGALLQYPGCDGTVVDFSAFIERVHAGGGLAVVAADILSLAVLRPPGEFGADIVVGSTQRFGVPMGYGGPHAAYFATKDEYKRNMPGRLIGVSKDATGRPALRLALQTREQHIRRAKATSNICTAQVLLAVMAGMYGVYHGPAGIKKIASRVHGLTSVLAAGLRKLGFEVTTKNFFDTLTVALKSGQLDEVWSRAALKNINLRTVDLNHVGISLDETTTRADVVDLLQVFNLGHDAGAALAFSVDDLIPSAPYTFEKGFARTSQYMTHPIFNKHHSETEMLRYIKRLEAKDLSLTTSMIPLGSCTMKLNATVEMLPVTWPKFGRMHPFAPLEQAQGYQVIFEKLEKYLAEITGFDAISLQPNAGSQGEYAGLLVIEKYHSTRGQGHRKVCLIPNSAHGTNPASAAMAGMEIVGVETDAQGNISVSDLRAKAEQHSANLAALMVTYPSTHGVFEESITEICEIIHKHGGQVYMDGANMNAQVGLCRPADFGADVCHLNLHKTFCIPHGGGGPGMGPIGVKAHLKPFLPSSPVVAMSPMDSGERTVVGGKPGSGQSVGAVSAAPWGSASILPISLIYIMVMGAEGLKRATQVAILNANYIAKRLEDSYPVLYRGREGLVAHECIVDLRPLKAASGVEVDDVAKRLMDYGYHAPTMSFPVVGTMMIEPTESETKEELDRFVDAMLSIRREISDVESGRVDRENNVLKRAPHTAEVVTADSWDRPYSRQLAAFPAHWTKVHKFWPPVSRIDNPFGDRNLMCACPPMEEYSG